MNYAIVEYKNVNKLFDVIPVDWIYYFEKDKFKKKVEKTHVSFYSSDISARAPVDINRKPKVTEQSKRKDGEFYKIIVHTLYGNYFDR